MKANCFYKHTNNTDVVMFVDKSLNKNDSLLLEVRWFNIVNSSNVFLINNDIVEVKKSDLKNWELFDVSTRGVF